MLADGHHLDCPAGCIPDASDRCLNWPSNYSLFHFYKRCVSQPCLVQAAFLQDQRGSISTTIIPIPIPVCPPCLRLDASHCMLKCPSQNICQPAQRALPWTTFHLCLNWDILSQLIPLHPKVKHWSRLLLPWSAFCRTDDSPLTKLKCQQHPVYHVFSTGYGCRHSYSLPNYAWLKWTIWTGGLGAVVTLSAVV